MSPVTIRSCTYHDLGKVVAIENESFSDPYPVLEFATHLISPRSKLVVACMNGLVVGYALAVHELGGDGQIRSIAVSLEFRRRGVGKLLMGAALEYLAECSHVYLLVRRTNETAIRLYRSFSFSETGRVFERYYLDGEDALEFEQTSSLFPEVKGKSE